MIELYDRYSQESRDLHESLVATGLSQLGVSSMQMVFCLMVWFLLLLII